MNNTTTDITYRVRTKGGERLFDNLDAAIRVWSLYAGSTIDKGRYEVVNGKTVWVKA